MSEDKFYLINEWHLRKQSLLMFRDGRPLFKDGYEGIPITELNKDVVGVIELLKNAYEKQFVIAPDSFSNIERVLSILKNKSL